VNPDWSIRHDFLIANPYFIKKGVIMKRFRFFIFGMVFVGTLIVLFLVWYLDGGWDSALIWILPAEIVLFFVLEASNRWVMPTIVRLLNKYDASG